MDALRVLEQMGVPCQFEGGQEQLRRGQGDPGNIKGHPQEDSVPLGLLKQLVLAKSALSLFEETF